MTTIAWKQGRLVADRQVTEGDTAIEECKLHIKGGWAIGTAGVSEEGHRFVEWYHDPGEAKCPLKKTDALIMSMNTGKCYYWEAKGHDKRLVEDEFAAIGSGHQFALGAMEAGASVERAVQIAIKRDINSGFGIDVAEAKKKAK